MAKGKLFKDAQDPQQLFASEDKQGHPVSMRGRGSWADMQRMCTVCFLTGREDDCSVSTVLWLFRLSFHLSVALGVFLFSSVSALEITIATAVFVQFYAHWFGH